MSKVGWGDVLKDKPIIVYKAKSQGFVFTTYNNPYEFIRLECTHRGISNGFDNNTVYVAVWQILTGWRKTMASFYLGYKVTIKYQKKR